MSKSDHDLVRETRAGRLAAFDELMRRYERLVCKVAAGYVKDKDSALDVTQNVFMKIYNHLEDVREEGMFKPWMLRITYNESVNWVRRQRRQRADTDEARLDRTPAPEPDPEASATRRERESRIVEGLAALNPKYQSAVALRYAEGLRIREIADVMGCSEGMVKSLLFRAVRQIKNRVERSV